MMARIRIDEREVGIDLALPISLAAEVRFTAHDPIYFGAPAASARPLVVGEFCGAVTAGASCNCSTLTLTPHCHGTHTECAGHLTLEPLDAYRVIPAGLLRAVLVSVVPEAASASTESTDPPPRPGDRLITRRELESHWPSRLAADVRALVLRTLARANEPIAASEPALPPYLSREATLFLLERGIEHLVIDLPSLDRLSDGGRLSAHRLFFGLPPGARELAAARRAHCTVTELASIPDTLADGAYLLELQVPALAGDAVPSRPLLYVAC
jgi:arylformamidase